MWRVVDPTVEAKVIVDRVDREGESGIGEHFRNCLMMAGSGHMDLSDCCHAS